MTRRRTAAKLSTDLLRLSGDLDELLGRVKHLQGTAAAVAAEPTDLRRLTAGAVVAVTLGTGMQAASASTVTARPGDSQWRLATQNGLTLSQFRQENGGPDVLIRAGQRYNVTPPASRRVTAQSGDTAWGLSQRHGMTLREFMALNPEVQLSPHHWLMTGVSYAVTPPTPPTPEARPAAARPAPVLRSTRPTQPTQPTRPTPRARLKHAFHPVLAVPAALTAPPFTTGLDVRVRSGLTVQDLMRLTAGTGLAGPEAARGFYRLEHELGINALFALAHADEESAYGSSNIYRRTANLFGFNATDSKMNLPDGGADHYRGPVASILAYGRALNAWYLQPPNGQRYRRTPVGAYWAGDTTIRSIFVHYSTAGQREAATIVSIMNTAVGRLKSAGQAPPG